jgi:shikimate dehydrogenase
MNQRQLADRASISGHTKLLVILAHPVEHVRTPSAMNAHLAAISADAVLVPMQVRPEDLADTVLMLRRIENLVGIVVTIPHKEKIVALCDELTEAARLVGAVNVIRREADGRLVGGQLDGEGFCAGLKAAGHEIRGRRVWMIGAGGAAAGIAYSLLRHEVAYLTLYNRTLTRAEMLAARLREAIPGARITIGGDNPNGHDIVINGTSLGLKPSDALPVLPSLLNSDMLVAEVVMQPDVTRFLEMAKLRGCQTHRGLPMLLEQVPILADFVLKPD